MFILFNPKLELEIFNWVLSKCNSWFVSITIFISQVSILFLLHIYLSFPTLCHPILTPTHFAK